MPTMRFTSVDGLKVFSFDSSPAYAVSQKVNCNPDRFVLKNEKNKVGLASWDVYSIGRTEDLKTPLRKFGVLEYQEPEWQGGPSKPWLR